MSFLKRRERQTEKLQRQQFDSGIVSPERYVKGVAPRTAWLLEVLAGFRIVKSRRRCASQQLPRTFDVFPVHLQLDAADGVGPEPIEAHQVIVGKLALDARRIQPPLRQQCLGEISKSRDCYESVRHAAASSLTRNRQQCVRAGAAPHQRLRG
jgi:hypothetical protein